MAPPASSTATATATDNIDIGLGPDGEHIVDPSYYILLGVKGDADDNAIKKAYRKQAMKYHPDKNPGDETAAAKFQEISEAYAQQGKKSAIDGAGGEEAMPDPGQIFSQMFGGKAFEDWVGEISLGKEMSTTEEEKAELKQELAQQKTGTAQTTVEASAPNGSPTPDPTTSHSAPVAENIPAEEERKTPPATAANASTVAPEATANSADAHLSKEDRRRKEQEQREKLEQYEKERAEEKRERVRVLTQKLRDRVRPFVEATNPGADGDPETQRFAERIKEEAHDLAMESFGVEICQLIGTIYMTKANSYIKLHKKAGNILGVAGWWSRVKEKGAMLKEGWSFLSVGLEVSRAMSDFEKRQENGAMPEEEMKQLESDLSGKMLLVAWKGSKFELSTVLRQVVDGGTSFKDYALTRESPSVTDEMLLHRARAIFLIGAILKSVTPSEEDDERRELERQVQSNSAEVLPTNAKTSHGRMVEEANRKRKEVKPKKAKKGVPDRVAAQ
ncbi:DnaJ-like protein [Microbotryomycetes sp. JL201]|nr:DnaJ-like protein [Microbotryomycetes sp. JL201]